MMNPFPTLVALIGLTLSVPASAASLVPMNLQKITDIAETIIHARVASQEVVMDDASQRIVTITNFDVIDTIKGEADSSHRIKQIGGRLPDSKYVHRVHGIPKFVNGMEYIVFLPPVSDLGFSSPVGLTQGNFRIENIDGEAVVRKRERPANALNAAKIAGSHGHDELPSAFQSVTDFKQQIRSLRGNN